MSECDAIVQIVLKHYPATEAIYLFGTYGTVNARAGSDVDIALLLPPPQAPVHDNFISTPCHDELAEALGRSVDLLNLRRVSTVLQKEIIASGRLLYTGDPGAVAEFEMLTLSYYQKLNEERQEILESFEATGKAYDV